MYIAFLFEILAAGELSTRKTSQAVADSIVLRPSGRIGHENLAYSPRPWEDRIVLLPLLGTIGGIARPALLPS